MLGPLSEPSKWVDSFIWCLHGLFVYRSVENPARYYCSRLSEGASLAANKQSRVASGRDGEFVATERNKRMKFFCFRVNSA